MNTLCRKEVKNSRSKVAEVENSEEDVVVSTVVRESTVGSPESQSVGARGDLAD